MVVLKVLVGISNFRQSTLKLLDAAHIMTGSLGSQPSIMAIYNVMWLRFEVLINLEFQEPAHSVETPSQEQLLYLCGCMEPSI